jgi:hypothetical protein
MATGVTGEKFATGAARVLAEADRGVVFKSRNLHFRYLCKNHESRERRDAMRVQV